MIAVAQYRVDIFDATEDLEEWYEIEKLGIRHVVEPWGYRYLQGIHVKNGTLLHGCWFENFLRENLCLLRWIIRDYSDFYLETIPCKIRK